MNADERRCRGEHLSSRHSISVHQRSSAVALAFSVLVAFALSGCDKRGAPRLTLYCGAGIRDAAEPLIAAFREKTGIAVSPTYAGSGRLLGQLSAARKGDLYMPGAELYVDIAVEKGLADAATKRIVMYFVPVILVRKGNPKGIRSVEDLKRKGLRVILGDDRMCAIGKKTLKVLEKNGVAWDDIKGNVVTRTGTVEDLGTAIQMRSADAAIVWDATARHFAESGTAVPIAPEKNSISAVPIAALSFSGAPAEARKFIEFVTSDEGRRVVRESGYTLSLPSGAAVR